MIVVDATVVAGFLFPADDFHPQAESVRVKKQRNIEYRSTKSETIHVSTDIPWVGNREF
jgi:hypothetical protein